MTPLTLLSFTGPAVSFHVMEVLHEEWPDRFYLSDNLRRVVEAGKTSFLGPDGGPDPEVLALYEVGDRPKTREQVLEAALSAMADEVRRLLDEGVVAEPQDVDLALILGGGYPMHTGGITPYLDSTGISERVTGKRFLPKGVASLP
jgi:3-hydroxyacyl-CoA dehydrogenase